MNKTGRLIVGVVAFVFAIILVFLSIKTFDLKASAYYENKQYGGDAYTGIQNAAAATARRVTVLNNTVAYIGGSLLLMGSFAFFVVALSFLAKHEDEECQKENKPYQPMYGNASQKTVPNHTTPVAGDGWKCICGKVNPKYVVTCSCGKSAREVREMSQATHRWICDGCGKMREKKPCEHCGKE